MRVSKSSVTQMSSQLEAELLLSTNRSISSERKCRQPPSGFFTCWLR